MAPLCEFPSRRNTCDESCRLRKYLTVLCQIRWTCNMGILSAVIIRVFSAFHQSVIFFPPCHQKRPPILSQAGRRQNIPASAFRSEVSPGYALLSKPPLQAGGISGVRLPKTVTGACGSDCEIRAVLGSTQRHTRRIYTGPVTWARFPRIWYAIWREFPAGSA